MLSFFATLHARPAAVASGPQLELAGRQVNTLQVPPALLHETTFACSFEQAMDELDKLDRMYCEPDGSFVWVSSQSEPPWQLDGNAYDRGGRLLFVDLKGTCPSQQLDCVLHAVGWPGTPVMFQLTREAVFLEDGEFRRFAEQASLPPREAGRA